MRARRLLGSGWAPPYPFGEAECSPSTSPSSSGLSATSRIASSSITQTPRLLVVVALANKMARMILAIATHETTVKGSASPEPADSG